MSFSDWLSGVCCLKWRCCCVAIKPYEKQPLVNGNCNHVLYTAGIKDENNIWNLGTDPCRVETCEDKELHNLILARDQLDKDTEEWQKLNYDIHMLRQARKEVRNRWRKVLEALGFQKEAESLLSVTKLSTICDAKNINKAHEFLLKLTLETSIFPSNYDLLERYLIVMDRLISLDAADEFITKASEKYPKNNEH
ncbi:melanoregulin [Protopterus annectens]|uniref:melanoregulin n=1 Tax=Protopterus annectens TaxID=7888 RepID=UPI001CFB35D0|nr:melanoregulin [Protopterus annectens]